VHKAFAIIDSQYAVRLISQTLLSYIFLSLSAVDVLWVGTEIVLESVN
jgi:hypothetical protein